MRYVGKRFSFKQVERTDSVISNYKMHIENEYSEVLSICSVSETMAICRCRNNYKVVDEKIDPKRCGLYSRVRKKGGALDADLTYRCVKPPLC